jgi:hypothetical protein
MCLKSEDHDIEENNNGQDKGFSSASMKLTFGVERILMKNDDNVKSSSHSEKFKDKDLRGLFLGNNNNNNQSALNDHHLNYPDIHELNNQNYIVKPFPLRFPKNEKGMWVVVD